ncbi:MAG: hypothetical protein IJN46_07415 [Lachnospiraceae bacterium]|nr:hypothetical protein [Lachnospiraceae bacterium]
MISFRPGSQVWQLITMLSSVGEFPMRSLHLLGNERVLKALIRRLTVQETIHNAMTGANMTCRLFSVSGKGTNKTIRLYKGALPILEWIHPDAHRYYLEAFRNHRFSGDASHWERNHRVAEAAALCLRAGIEARPYYLPHLQNKELLSVIPEHAVMYLAKEIKKVSADELNKTMFTRMVGAVFVGKCCYAVYNTRDAVMKWSGMGEFKTLYSLIDLARMNAGESSVDTALLLGQSEEIALRTLFESDKSARREFRFDSIYRHIHYIPMNESGIRQMRLITVPDWKEKFLELLFEPEARAYHQGMFEYDAYLNGVYVFSHLDGDLARLVRFKEAIIAQTGRFEVLCFPYQVSLINEYMGGLVTIKIIDMDLIEQELCPERRDLLER